MATPVASLHVLAHRACLEGPRSVDENARSALAEAVGRGFGVELDVRLDGGLLTLAHDPAPWSPDRDAEAFLRDPGPGPHALNVKDLDAVEPVLAVLDDAGTAGRFFLFDFELLGAREALLDELQERGYRVAHRLSEREPHFHDYLDRAAVTDLWLDEWEEPWVREEHVRALGERGKRTWYVSPELHRPLPVDAVAPRWRQLAAWGVTGICTDYPIDLRRRLS